MPTDRACSNATVLVNFNLHQGAFRRLGPSSKYLAPKLHVSIEFMGADLFKPKVSSSDNHAKYAKPCGRMMLNCADRLDWLGDITPNVDITPM